MFTPQDKWALFQRLQTAARDTRAMIHLVTHNDPDQDGAAGAHLLLKKLGIPCFSPRIVWHFVPQGDLLDLRKVNPRDLPSERDLVIHIDTGGMLDIDALIFDHHFVGCEYHSATGVLFDLLYVAPGRSVPNYIRRLVEFVDRIDSGHEVGDLDETVYETIDLLNEMLLEAHGPVGRFRASLPEPLGFMKLVKNKPEGAPEALQMIVMIYALECDAREAQMRYQVKTRFKEEIEPQMEIREVGGLQIAFSPMNPFKPSEFRDAVNSRLAKTATVAVYENTGFPEARGRFAITVLSRQTKLVAGMEELAQSLRQLAPQAHVFLHPKKFLIYVKEINGVPLPFDFQGLSAQVEMHLSKKKIMIGQAELPFTKEAPIA